MPSPVFVISSVRSGSTLLRVLLNSHDKLHAPHELHLRTIRVQLEQEFTEKAVDALELDQEELEHLLWDRLLHRELQRSGKEQVIDKTPGNAAIWKRLHEAWPQARFIFLLRHPAAIVESLMISRPDRDVDQTVRHIHRYVQNVDEARRSLPGLTVRYEDLTADPERVTAELCEFLGVPWQQKMLNYGKRDHGDYVVGIGDWSKNIRSGQVQSARELPAAEDVPELLRPIATSWGYDA